MDRAPPNFPVPDRDALAASAALTALIEQDIDAAGGWIGFDRYMQRALYEPGLGYYSGGSAKLGPAGDFVTAPELSDALARAVAAMFMIASKAFDAPVVLEVGAGLGTLAGQLIEALRGRLRKYSIFEPSADLRARQRRRLVRTAVEVAWLDTWPTTPFDGFVVANEVADALPVEVFVKTGGKILPLGVSRRAGGLAWAEGPEQPELTSRVTRLEHRLGAPLPDGYRSELRPSLPAWIATLAASLERGGVMLVDYGYERSTYYHPQRSSGTLMCHYRHRAHGDPFLYPGLQDLTAWVDFSACADAAREAGLDVAGYTTQGQFIVEALGADLAGSLTPGAAALSALKTLILPGEMGERFKVLWLTKRLPGLDLPGRDLRARLR